MDVCLGYTHFVGIEVGGILIMPQRKVQNCISMCVTGVILCIFILSEEENQISLILNFSAFKLSCAPPYNIYVSRSSHTAAGC